MNMRKEPILIVDGEVTSTQLVIMALIVQGYLRKQISVMLHMSQNTVNSHISDIFRRLRVHSVGHMVAKAMAGGFNIKGHFRDKDVVRSYLRRIKRKRANS
jgi:DNA-binding CsgD family transcriptional regulator